MARRKSRIKLPFLKLKINKQTIINVIGFILIALAFVLLISFLKTFSSETDGKILYIINQTLIAKFGGMSVITPFIILLIAGHFFNSRKLKLVKANLTVGLILIFIALLGFFRAGDYGRVIFDNLTLDFSKMGAYVILIVLLIIGTVFFLDTSIDVFLLFLIDNGKKIFAFIRSSLFSENNKKPLKIADKKGMNNQGFIEDIKKIEKQKSFTHPTPAAQASVSPATANQDIIIKPLPQSGSSTWVYPPITLLADVSQAEADRGDVNGNAQIIEETLNSFGIRARVVEVNRGPAVTQYALEITMGTKLSKITALGNDLALAIAAPTGTVRIEAPIPGRALVGIEIPNIRPEIVTLKKLLNSPKFVDNSDPLTVPLGLDVSGMPQVASLSKMPHALIAGTTGSGKSVLLNAWITTLLYRTKPEELRIILVDPKRVELTLYNDVPHLLTPVVVEAKKIISALRWTVGEMESRYKIFSKAGARNLDGYNEIEGVEKKPYIIFVIDELADLMIFAPGEAEDLITRIAQMARATGIHLVLATQRPSVDVITGLMKANIPTRVAFNVSSMIDSRVIIDMPGAEKLLGRGDMLFLPPDKAKPVRIQGPFISEKEVNNVVKFLRSQSPLVHYTTEVTEMDSSTGNTVGGTTLLSGGSGGKDPYFDKAIEIISQFDKASASLLQRRLSIGFSRAGRLLDELEAEGYIGPPEGSKPRTVLKRPAANEIEAIEAE